MVVSGELRERERTQALRRRVRVFEACKKGKWGCVYVHADNRRRNAGALMGYNSERTCRARIPRIRVRDIPIMRDQSPYWP